MLLGEEPVLITARKTSSLWRICEWIKTISTIGQDRFVKIRCKNKTSYAIS